MGKGMIKDETKVKDIREEVAKLKWNFAGENVKRETEYTYYTVENTGK